MAISFPRAIPDALLVTGLTFLPDPVIEITPTKGGGAVSVDLGPTLWRGKWDSDTLDEARFGEVRAWYDTLLNEREFYGYDKLREYPLNYTGGFTGLLVGTVPFDGTCTLAGVPTGSVSVELEDLPAGFILAPGDYLHFDYGTSRALHRVSAQEVADTNGQMEVEVRPYVRLGWEADTVVTLYRAAARMVILPGSYSERIVPGTFGQASFEARQVL